VQSFEIADDLSDIDIDEMMVEDDEDDENAEGDDESRPRKKART
jgi:hypothetical protein